MLSFHVKFVQTDRQTDGQTYRHTTVKRYAPNLSMWGHKKPNLNLTKGNNLKYY